MNARSKIWVTIGLFAVIVVSAGLLLIGNVSGLFGDAAENRIGATNRGPFHSAGPFKVQVSIEPERPRIGKNRVTVLVRDKDGQPVPNAEIRALAEMPAMGAMPAMRAPAEMSAMGHGSYTGTFELPMDGAWPLTLTIQSNTLGQARLRFDMTTSRKGLRLATASPSATAQAPVAVPATGNGGLPTISREAHPGTIQLDARRRQLIGVTTDEVKRKRLTQTIRAAGQVTYDETRSSDMTLKFDGWIGKLYADYVGAQVTKGRALFTIYSPELVSAQDEYLETRRRRKRDDSLLAASRRRLALWDIGPAQIRALEKRGHAAEYVPILSPTSGTVIEKHIVAGSAVKAGATLLRIANLSKVWVEGQVYEYELPHVAVGMDAKVVLPDLPGLSYLGKVAYVYPYLEGDTRTARVRVELANPNGILRPDMYTHLLLDVDLGERLVVPEGAVLHAGKSRVVFVDLGDGRFQPRKVKTGLRNSDYIEVTEGLTANEVVVTSGNFLIATESKLKAGIEQW